MVGWSGTKRRVLTFRSKHSCAIFMEENRGFVHIFWVSLGVEFKVREIGEKYALTLVEVKWNVDFVLSKL